MSEENRAAIGYVRVASGYPADIATGIASQESAIRLWGEENRVLVVAVVRDEGISDATEVESRSGLAEVLLRLERGEANELVVHRLDRLSRRVVTLLTMIERLEHAGVRVTAVSGPDSTAASSVTLGMASSVAHDEGAALRRHRSASGGLIDS